jgi:hypothetical protein
MSIWSKIGEEKSEGIEKEHLKVKEKEEEEPPEEIDHKEEKGKRKSQFKL